MVQPSKMTTAEDGAAATSGEEMRRRAILAGAADLFFGQGFDAVSVDAIVARAGGSKTNVYRLFGNKDGLFETLITEECGRLTTPLRGTRLFAETATGLAAALAQIGRAYIDVITDERSLSIHRLVIAQAQRFPQLARVFLAAGPEAARHLIAEAFAVLDSRALLDAGGDSPGAARRFVDLLRGDLQMKLLLGVEGTPAPETRDRLVADACAAFMRPEAGAEGAARRAAAAAPAAPDAAPARAGTAPDALAGNDVSSAEALPDAGLGDQVGAAHRALQRRLRGVIAPHGLTLDMWSVLRVEEWRDGPSQRDLSRRIDAPEPTVLSAIAALEARGLVRRDWDAQDRRRRRVVLTPQGLALRSDLISLEVGVVRDAAAGLSRAEMARLLGQLVTIQANLAALRAMDPEDDR